MAPQVKNAGIMTILSVLFTTMIISVVSWVGVNATHVPELEQELEYKIARLDTSIKRLTKVVEGINTALTAHNKAYAASIARITEVLTDHKYRIIAIERNCNETHINVKEYAKYKGVNK